MSGFMKFLSVVLFNFHIKFKQMDLVFHEVAPNHKRITTSVIRNETLILSLIPELSLEFLCKGKETFLQHLQN